MPSAETAGMPSVADELQARCDGFGVRIATLLRGLARDPVTDALARQLARSASGIGGNYRTTRRSRSRVEFIARLAVVLEEADETVHWLEQISGASLATAAEIASLLDEARQLRAIFSRSLQTAKQNYAAHKASTRRRKRTE